MNWPLSVPPNSPANRRRISAINSERERWPSSRNAEVAATEQTSEPYVGRVLRMTLLAPDIVEAILGGRQPAQMTLAVLMRLGGSSGQSSWVALPDKISGRSDDFCDCCILLAEICPDARVLPAME